MAQAATNTSGRSYDPGARFFDVTEELLQNAGHSQGNKLRLVFEVLLEEFHESFQGDVVKEAMKNVAGWDELGDNSRIWDCRVFNNNEDKSKYFLISSHLLGFYRTYADKATFAMLQKIGQRQVPRQFPTAEQAKAAHELLGFSDNPFLEGPGGDPGVQHTETNLSTDKSNGAKGKPRKPNQAKAVGGTKSVSATDVSYRTNATINALTYPSRSLPVRGEVWVGQAEREQQRPS